MSLHSSTQLPFQALQTGLLREGQVAYSLLQQRNQTQQPRLQAYGFIKMIMITLYAREQKRHRGIEQSFGLCGRGRGWDDLGEWH